MTNFYEIGLIVAYFRDVTVNGKDLAWFHPLNYLRSLKGWKEKEC